VSLTNPELTLGTGTEGSSLSFEMNGGPEVKLFDIDTPQLEQAATPDGTLDLHGRMATLSSARLVEADWCKGEWSTLRIYAVLDREWRAGVAARQSGPHPDR
jgi:hypothetical protein